MTDSIDASLYGVIIMSKPNCNSQFLGDKDVNLYTSVLLKEFVYHLTYVKNLKHMTKNINFLHTFKNRVEVEHCRTGGGNG